MVGKKIAELCLQKNIEKVCFDRGGNIYHGRVQVRQCTSGDTSGDCCRSYPANLSCGSSEGVYQPYCNVYAAVLIWRQSKSSILAV